MARSVRGGLLRCWGGCVLIRIWILQIRRRLMLERDHWRKYGLFGEEMCGMWCRA